MNFIDNILGKTPKSNSATILTERLTQMTLQVRGEINAEVQKEIEDAVFNILTKYHYRINRQDVHMVVQKQDDDKMGVSVTANNVNPLPTTP